MSSDHHQRRQEHPMTVLYRHAWEPVTGPGVA